jgi:hypothetical protein
MRMPAMDVQYYCSPAAFRSVIVNPNAPVAKKAVESKLDAEVMDFNLTSLYSNPNAALMLGELDVASQWGDVLECTSVVRKRRLKMNKHKLKKRIKRERFNTRKPTTG